MSLYPLELEANIIQLIMVVTMTAWFAFHNKGKMGMTKFLFFWGLLSCVLMNVYWVCMIFVDGSGNYATFTACDTATISLLLIWTAMFYRLNQADNHLKYAKSKLPLIMVIFGTWNVVWWALWTGNVVINVLWGVPFTLLLYFVFYHLKKAGALAKADKIVWWLLFVILFIFEIPMYLYERGSVIYVLSDWICVIAWLVYVVAFIIRAWKDRKNRTVWLFAAKLYSMIAQYLTDGIKYSIFMIIETLIMIVLVITFELHKIEEDENL